VNGLKEEIRYTMQSQVPEDVDRAVLLAKIQQKIIDRGKAKTQRGAGSFKPTNFSTRSDQKGGQSGSTMLWKERQLRDYRKTNGLCFYCGDKFDPAHIEVCQKRQKPQMNALVLNDLDQPQTDEVLNQLAVEDVLSKELGHLSLNAIAGTDTVTASKSDHW
jgi:hypothetical protein